MENFNKCNNGKKYETRKTSVPACPLQRLVMWFIRLSLFIPLGVFELTLIILCLFFGIIGFKINFCRLIAQRIFWMADSLPNLDFYRY